MFEFIKSLWDKIFEDRSVIRSNPISFIAIAILSGIVTWWVTSLNHTRELKGAEERIKLADDRTATAQNENIFLKTQLKGQLPEQAAKQNSGLQNEVNLIQKQIGEMKNRSLPWQISKKEKNKLVEILKVGSFSFPKAPKVIIFCSDPSNLEYCKEWEKVLTESGWSDLEFHAVMGLHVPPHKRDFY